MPIKDSDNDDCGVPPVTFRGFPKAACQLHDRMYVKGSWAQQHLTRLEADRHFLTMLLEMSGRNPLKRAASYVLYRLVRLLGAPYWEGKQ